MSEAGHNSVAAGQLRAMVERMSQAKADMEMGCMEAIRDDLKALADAERADGDLFGGKA